MAKHNWYKILALGDTTEISIFDEIGIWGVNASDFRQDLDAIAKGTPIRLLLNSPGGNVFDGMAIYNMLAGRREDLTVEIMGVAASAASIIALAGSSLTMAEGTYYMIHNPYTMAIGDADEMEKTAALLRKMSGEFANIYEANSSLSRDEILSLMKDETWMTAAVAVEYGFVDEVEAVEHDVAASARTFAPVFARYGFEHVPDTLQSEARAADDTQKATDESAKAGTGKGPGRRMLTKRGAERALRDAGFSANVSKQILAGGYPREEEPQPKQAEKVEDSRARARRLLAANYDKLRR